MLFAKHAFIDIDGTIVEADETFRDDPEIGTDFFRGVLRDMLGERRNLSPADAIEEIRGTEVQFNGCMFKTAWKLDLSPEDYWNRIVEWERRHLSPFSDAIDMVKKLKYASMELHVVSNNSCHGILAKLHRAGLADMNGSGYFKTIFGMDVFGIGYAKGDPHVFSKALEIAGIAPGDVVTIGDDPSQDWRVPASAGISKSIIVKRAQREPMLKLGDGVYSVNNLRVAAEICRGN